LWPIAVASEHRIHGFFARGTISRDTRLGWLKLLPTARKMSVLHAYRRAGLTGDSYGT
jgi:hypothetical protein